MTANSKHNKTTSATRKENELYFEFRKECCMRYKKKSKNVSIRCTGHVKITETIL